MTREEAIRRIKAWNLDSDDREVLAVIIPELRESEDEKIRAVILKLVLGMRDEIFTSQDDIVTKDKALAYLEKQKEQKPILEVFGFKVGDAVRLKDGDGRKHIIKSFEEVEGIHGPNFYHVEFEDNSARDGIYPGEEYPNGYYTQMEKFEEEQKQKPAEWSEDWREEDVQTRFAFYTYKDDPSTLYLSNVFVEETSRNHGFGTRILKAAEKAAEAIGAITICLKVKQDSPANAWYRKNGYGYVAFEDGYDWLEKNLEYMKPNKQEWSEEDEKTLASIIDYLDRSDLVGYDEFIEFEEFLKSLKNRGNFPKSNTNSPSWSEEEEQMFGNILNYYSLIEVPTDGNGISKERYVAFIKSLRSRPKSSDNWKPSEEQMSALQCAIAFMEIRKASDYDISPLKLLYEQLKAL